jgi:DNA-binding transcriptional LysR family regulator
VDKLNSMKVFLQVARLGSFSAAAEYMGISKAMASKHVSHLENELDIRLFNRTTRHLNITDSGQLYRDRVSRILEDMEETELSVAKMSSEPSGSLRIMAPNSFGTFHLTRAIVEYKKRYPKVTIDMIFTNRAPDFVGEGLDLAIRTGELKDSSQIARKLAQSRLVVCGSPEYFENWGIPESPSELEKHNCLVFSLQAPVGSWLFTGKKGSYTQGVSGNFKASGSDALRIAAIQGAGLVQLPTYMVGLDIKSGRLKAVLEDFEPEPRPIYAVYLHRTHLSAKVSTFVDFLYDLYNPEPYWEKW